MTYRMILTGALLAAAPVSAQQMGHEGHQMPMEQEGMQQQCMAMMGGPQPHMVLQHAEHLVLTAEQVSQLEALSDEAGTASMQHMRPAMEAHTAAAAALQGDSPDFRAYEANLRAAADHMIQAHVSMAWVGVETGKLLTPDQQASLESMMGGHGEGMMMDHGAGMTMDQGAGHAGMGAMMMMCPMMGH